MNKFFEHIFGFNSALLYYSTTQIIRHLACHFTQDGWRGSNDLTHRPVSTQFWDRICDTMLQEHKACGTVISGESFLVATSANGMGRVEVVEDSNEDFYFPFKRWSFQVIYHPKWHTEWRNALDEKLTCAAQRPSSEVNCWIKRTKENRKIN